MNDHRFIVFTTFSGERMIGQNIQV
ncbi:hypothetical protein [Photobacterium sp. TY1-4]